MMLDSKGVPEQSLYQTEQISPPNDISVRLMISSGGTALPLWTRVRQATQEPFAEFLGTMVMVLLLQGVVAQITLSQLEAGTYYAISVVTGLAATVGVLIAGPVSGGHLNPSVTLAFSVFRGFPLSKVPGFIIGQILGGYCGAALVYVNYREAIDAVEGRGVRTHQTAVIFSTYPQAFLSKAGQFFSEFLATTVLVMGILAMTSTRHPAVVRELTPLWLFFLILGIGAALGWETGYAMNIARDFAPRLFAYCAGYGVEVWTYGNYYWWVPVVAPLCGALAAGILYDTFICTGDSQMKKSWSHIWLLMRLSRDADRHPQV